MYTNEFYDELVNPFFELDHRSFFSRFSEVFQDPSEFLLDRLQSFASVPLTSDDSETIENQCSYLRRRRRRIRTFVISIVLDAREKDETLAKIRQARQRIRDEIQEFTERLRITQENLQRLRQSSTTGTTN